MRIVVPRTAGRHEQQRGEHQRRRARRQALRYGAR
jgi:hypothetical protein